MPRPPRRRSPARAMTSRTSAVRRRLRTAPRRRGPDARATSRASVVLPVPGGPNRIIECGAPCSIAVRSAVPSAEQVRLADDLVERLRPHARGERRAGSVPLVGLLGLGRFEELVHVHSVTRGGGATGGDRPRSGRPDPLQHGQPAWQRASGAEWLRDYLAEAGLEVELDGAEEDRPNLVATLGGPESGPVLGYLGHTDTVLADPADVDARPLVGRGPRRPRLGPRRDRHEVPGRRRGGRRRAPRALRLASRARRTEDLRGRRRGDRRPARRPVAHPGAPGPRPLRLPAQRGRRHGPALRRASPLRRVLRREGDLPLPHHRARPRRACFGARARPTTRWSSSRRSSPPSPRSRRPTTSPTRRAALITGLGEDPDDPAAALANITARAAPMGALAEPPRG